LQQAVLLPSWSLLFHAKPSQANGNSSRRAHPPSAALGPTGTRGGVRGGRLFFVAACSLALPASLLLLPPPISLSSASNYKHANHPAHSIRGIRGIRHQPETSQASESPRLWPADQRRPASPPLLHNQPARQPTPTLPPNQSASQPAAQPAFPFPSLPTNQAASRPANQLPFPSQPTSQPASEPASKPAPRPCPNRPASPPASQPAKRLRRAASEQLRRASAFGDEPRRAARRHFAAAASRAVRRLCFGVRRRASASPSPLSQPAAQPASQPAS